MTLAGDLVYLSNLKKLLYIYFEEKRTYVTN